MQRIVMAQKRPGYDGQGFAVKIECSSSPEIQRCSVADPAAQSGRLSRSHGQNAGLCWTQ